MSGRVFLVPTPIGNRGDITLRALDVLRSADRIACEDTRRTAPLLEHLGITGKSLTSLHEHNETKRVPELATAAAAGEMIALVSDAGTPGISDPGYRLIQACLEADIPYEVLPGASAVLTALIGSGFPTHAFHFLGFLPVKKGKRLAALERALETDGSTLFFESPHRLLSTLELFAEAHPDAFLCVARELTKRFETYHRDTAVNLLEHFRAHPPKGEIVLVLSSRS